MKLLRSTTVFVAALAIAACDGGPTGPANDQVLFDAMDPVSVRFAGAQGLPDRPHAAFPDSLKLSAGQKAEIESLVAAFEAANAADLAAMKAAHDAARDARRAGKSRGEVKAILDGARAAAERVRASAESLRAAIQNVLTTSQRAWLEAHRPDRPPRTP